MAPLSRRPARAAALLALLLAACGRPGLAGARGRVTLDGQPLADAYVVFCPTQQGTTSYGKTDADGRYRMLFKDNEPGAWLGETLVRISTGDLAAGDRAAAAERVPVVYNVKTTLKVEVEKKDNVFDFDLKSDAGKVVQPVDR